MLASDRKGSCRDILLCFELPVTTVDEYEDEKELVKEEDLDAAIFALLQLRPSRFFPTSISSPIFVANSILNQVLQNVTSRGLKAAWLEDVDF